MKNVFLFICMFPLWLHAQQAGNMNVYAGINTRLIDKVPLEFTAKVIFPSGFGLAGSYSWYHDVERYNPNTVVSGNRYNYLGGSTKINASAHCFRIGGLYAFEQNEKRLFTVGVNFVNSFIANDIKVAVYDPYYWKELIPLYAKKEDELVQALELELNMSFRMFKRVYFYSGITTGFALKQPYKMPVPPFLQDAVEDRVSFIPGLGFGGTYINFSVGVIMKINPDAAQEE